MKPSELRELAQIDMENARGDVDEAFDHGEVVVVRTQVRPGDLDAIACVRVGRR